MAKRARRAFSLLRQAWRSQSELWERWYEAPYKDDGPLRWQRRGETWELDGAQIPAQRRWQDTHEQEGIR